MIRDIIIIVTYKRALVFLIIFIVAIELGLNPLAESEQNEIICFNWVFAVKDAQGQIKAIDFNTRTKLTSKDLFKIFLQPIKNAYIYLYFYDSEKQLSLIFPKSIDFFSGNYGPGVKYFIPEHAKWFSVNDSSGVEKFFLIVSKDRLYKLEDLTKEYATIYNDGSSSSYKINAAKQKVLDEMTNIKQQNSTFAVLAEKPIPIAGSIRGENAKIESCAIHVEAEVFYAKTIRLEH